MIERAEAVKVQLTEAHKYVQQFLSMRIAVFGTTVGFVGAILAVLYKVDNNVHARISLWAFILLILLFAGQMLGAMGRAIWLFCAHMFIMERDFYGPGGNHQWIVANLINHRYSSTYGLYVAFIFLLVAILPLLVVDVVTLGLTSIWLASVLTIAVLSWGVLVYLTVTNMKPRRVIEDAVAQAIVDEEMINKYEEFDLAQLDTQKRTDPRLIPYINLLSAWKRRPPPSPARPPEQTQPHHPAR